jgi:hypothetical protein
MVTEASNKKYPVGQGYLRNFIDPLGYVPSPKSSALYGG